MDKKLLYRLYEEDGGAYGDFQTTIGIFSKLDIDSLVEIIKSLEMGKRIDPDDWEGDVFLEKAKYLLGIRDGDVLSEFLPLGMEIIEDSVLVKSYRR